MDGTQLILEAALHCSKVGLMGTWDTADTTLPGLANWKDLDFARESVVAFLVLADFRWCQLRVIQSPDLRCQFPAAFHPEPGAGA